MSESPRLPAALEVAALIRQAGALGGFASVWQKGEADGGTVLLLLTERGENARIYERMPDANGHRVWHCSMKQDTDNKELIEKYLSRRGAQDRDLWIVELDIAHAERLIGLRAPDS